MFIAGQLSGVEGYVESTAMGFLAGINASRWSRNEDLLVPPATTAIGALIQYIIGASPEDFQPMNVNFGLFPPLAKKVRKNLKRRALATRSLADLDQWLQTWKH